MPSPFLNPGDVAHTNSLAILHLRRDSLIATKLQDHDSEDEGYDEGKVTNTRFGSYPHSTLLGVPWGSQVRASAVDTGSRGRRKPEEKLKRKELHHGGVLQPKAAIAATSGFAHLLPPTPESWTTSLPHRTQVVYTPDYSYILHRLRVRPGSVIIEAGAGSGSFTHAAARAVFSGYVDESYLPPRKRRKLGKVFSFEFHEQRITKLKEEIQDHGLDDIVHITHRDVCNDGFHHSEDSNEPDSRANAVFLDLPAPWLALKHLTRGRALSSQDKDSILAHQGLSPPLDSKTPIHICTFSPCIEQVQRTVSALRSNGWLEIEMVELTQRRIEVRRERVGLHEEGLRGVNASAATVEEAVTRLREVETSTKEYHENKDRSDRALGLRPGETGEDKNVFAAADRETEIKDEMSIDSQTPPSTLALSNKRQRIESIKSSLADREIFREGRLVSRSELELKTHTSYLVFAVLPQEWTEEDEEECQRKSPVKVEVASHSGSEKSRRQMKRETRRKAEEREANGRLEMQMDSSKGEDTGSREAPRNS